MTVYVIFKLDYYGRAHIMDSVKSNTDKVGRRLTELTEQCFKGSYVVGMEVDG